MKPISSSGWALAPALLILTVALLPLQAHAPSNERQADPQSKVQAQPLNDLDAFMARVLERRDETWRKLHDYVLDETEQLRIVGPGGVPLHGMKREFTWYVRDGFLIRSPLRFDGVSLSEADRRAYEQRWLEQEKAREARAAKRAEGKAKDKGAPGGSQEEAAPQAGAADPPGAGAGDASLQTFVDQRGEPRFISEAYFLRFRFEAGNYYVAGRDTLDGRPVVKVEYYPTRLFRDQQRRAEGREPPSDPAKQKQRAEDQEYERKFNKVALITLWIDPAEYQIVRYTFENMDFGFLPARWLVRLDEARASMTMARVLDGVWLPAEISMRGAFSLANGSYEGTYSRRFANYKKAETGARIRSYTPKDDR